MPSNEYIKKRTQEIYDSLPQDKEARKKCFAERDEILELNYAFFGYIAAHKFVNNSYITYEDRLQSALLHFCEIWWWYKWKGDETHKAYRDDLAFSVFFKPRITEMMERDFDEVKYSLRRQLCIEAANQLNILWTQLKYDDLVKVKLPEEKMIALRAIFGTLYTADFEEHEMFIAAKEETVSPFDDPSDEYDTIEELLIHDMIVYEEKLTDAKLRKMSEIYGIDFKILKEKLPIAESMLKKRLEDAIADQY
ncbi:MAG: hypothetical protein IKM72_18120 [Oscillospiraceae bacterium]|nr:hypothetical protein [Oscillospiraceae bacterium]